MKIKLKRNKRYRRHVRIRGKISGLENRPRLCVFKSNKHIYAQLINDKKGKTILTAGDLEIKRKKTEKSAAAKTKEDKGEKRTGKSVLAFEVGKLIAKKALEKKFDKVVFDRGGYKYHGRVKALAEGAREGGLKF